MGIFDDDMPKAPVASYVLGADVSLLSADDLRERIAELHEEIVRLESELEARGTTKDAAEAFFRKP